MEYFKNKEPSIFVFQPSLQTETEYTPPPSDGPFGERGVFGGSYTNTANMDYISISTTGNSQVFGVLSITGYGAMCSNSIKGLHGGGGGSGTSLIEYITIATLGDGTLFGYLTAGRWGLAACSNVVRGFFFGGYGSSLIDYITIATNSNSNLFGYITGTTSNREIAAMSNETRAIITNSGVSSLAYITINSLGNTLSFGNLSANRTRVTGLSNLTYGYVIGGLLGYATRIDVITMATLSNSSIFGSTILDRTTRGGGCSNGTRGIVGGGLASATNAIEYFNMSTTGSSNTFGSLTVYKTESAACSGN